MPQRWTLPGPDAPYLIVRQGDKDAPGNYQPVPLWSVKARLDEWLKTRWQTMQAIHDSIQGRASGSSQATSSAQIKQNIGRAFETRKLIALEQTLTITLPEAVVVGCTIKNVPFSAKGEELKILLAMRLGERTREQALSLIRSGRVSELDKAENSGKGFATLSISQAQYDLLKGRFPTAAPGAPRSGTTGTGLAGTTDSRGTTTYQQPAQKQILSPPSPQQRKDAAVHREKLKTRLYGLEALYRKLTEYQSLLKSMKSIPSRDEFGVREQNHFRIQESVKKLQQQLVAQLRMHGFGSIGEFEDVINAYASAFQQETLSSGLDFLYGYDQALQKEAVNYQDDKKSTELYQALGRTDARKDYEQAAANRQMANAIRPDPDLHRYLPSELELKREAQKKAADYRSKAEHEVASIASDYPLLSQEDFNRERLASSTPVEIQRMTREYIQARRKDVRDCWNELSQNPLGVYKLDKLLKTSYALQQIATGSIYDLIIRDQIAALHSQELVSTLLLTVVALVLGLFTFGQGTIAVLAVSASVGLGAYAVLEEFRRYEFESAAHGAQLLSDDPSLAWVILAIIGAGLDLAGAAALLKEVRLAATLKAFNGSSDLVAFEKSLKQLSHLNAQLRTRMLSAARAEVKYRRAIRQLFAQGGKLHVSVLGAEQLGRLLVVVYHLTKRGVIAFDQFLLELKAIKIIKDIEKLAPEELTLLKQAFEQNKTLVAQLTEHGKSLGMSAEELDTFILGLSDKAGDRLTLKQLKEQMKARTQKALPAPPSAPRVRPKPGKPRKVPTKLGEELHIDLSGKTGGIIGEYNPRTRDLYIHIIEVAEEFGGQHLSVDLYRSLIEAAGDVETITGKMAFSNAEAIRRTGDFLQTPRAKALNRLGYTEHTYIPPATGDKANGVLVSRKPSKRPAP